MSLVELSWWAGKVTLLLTAVWAASFVFRGSNPRWQLWSFRIGAVGIVLLTILSLSPPLLTWQVLQVAGDVPATSEAFVDDRGDDSANTKTSRAVLPPEGSPSESGVEDTRSKDSGPAEAASAQSSEESVAEPFGVPRSSSGKVDGRASDMPTGSDGSADQGRSWSWISLLFVVWAIGVMWHSVRCVAGWIGARRLLRNARPAEAAMLTVADDIAARMRMTPPVVVVSDGISTPSVVGLRKPTILLPDGISGQDLDASLAHELCHVAGNDLRWDCLVQWIQALCWPHPLSWKIVSCHRDACERVCDLIAAETIADRQGYANCLARIAAKLHGGSECGMAMARSPQIVGRMRALSSRLTARPLGGRGRLAALATAVLIVGFGGSAVVHVKETLAESPDVQPRKMTFTVLDATNDLPLEDAQVNFRYFDTKYTRKSGKTNEKGIATFVFPDPKETAFLRIMTKRSGYVPYYASFDRQPPGMLPTSKVIRMSPGRVIGGTITDESGNPVAGAEVVITVPSIDPPRQNHVYSLLDITTGPDGRWTLDAAPVPVTALSLRVEHDRFQNGYFSVTEPSDSTYVLKRGWSIAGTVTDGTGRPVAGAEVIPGTDRFGSSLPNATTDDEGRFELFGLKKTETKLTVSADGHAPQIVDVIPDASEVAKTTVQLDSGNTIRFRFVDSKGQPVAGAWITSDTWRGLRTVDWDGKSDADGWVTWTGAPPDTVVYDSGRRGYRSRRNVARIAQEEPHTIVLRREFVAEGTVRNAQTDRPIDDFKAQFGWGSEGEIHWSDQEAIQGRNGKFRLAYEEGRSGLHLRITADGFEPWVSENLDEMESMRSMEVGMHPGSGPSGVVRTPSGEPAVAAVVALGIEGNSFQFQSGYRPYNPAQQKTTDAQGRFELRALQTGVAGILAVIHETGYAEVALSELVEAPEIQLSAWASLDFKVTEEGQPVAGRTVDFRPAEDRSRVVSIFAYSIGATTDANGFARIERVIPTNGYVSMALSQETYNGSISYSHASRPIALAPGESKTVQFGGRGKTVMGKILLPDDPPANHRWKT
ncbi:MAG: M56 family metallopeptidase, partial [Planctomycetota bacterium]